MCMIDRTEFQIKVTVLLLYSILTVAGYGLIFDPSLLWMLVQTLAIVGFGLMTVLLLYLPVLVWKARRSGELADNDAEVC